MYPNKIPTTDGNETAAIVVHDIRNSLNIILMRTQLLSLYAARNEINIETVQTSSETIERQVELIQQLLNTLKP